MNCYITKNRTTFPNKLYMKYILVVLYENWNKSSDFRSMTPYKADEAKLFNYSHSYMTKACSACYARDGKIMFTLEQHANTLARHSIQLAGPSSIHLYDHRLAYLESDEAVQTQLVKMPRMLQVLDGNMNIYIFFVVENSSIICIYF